MYHAHFRGTHYEMGFRFGSSLAKNNRFVLDNVPFPITAERKEFACACIPLYREYFPEILEEISGLADVNSGRPVQYVCHTAVLLLLLLCHIGRVPHPFGQKQRFYPGPGKAEYERYLSLLPKRFP